MGTLSAEEFILIRKLGGIAVSCKAKTGSACKSGLPAFQDSKFNSRRGALISCDRINECQEWD
jgi:hypothetical protein